MKKMAAFLLAWWGAMAGAAIQIDVQLRINDETLVWEIFIDPGQTASYEHPETGLVIEWTVIACDAESVTAQLRMEAADGRELCNEELHATWGKPIELSGHEKSFDLSMTLVFRHHVFVVKFPREKELQHL